MAGDLQNFVGVVLSEVEVVGFIHLVTRTSNSYVAELSWSPNCVTANSGVTFGEYPMNRVSRSRSLHLPGAAALLIAIFTSSVRANDDSLYVDMAIAKKSTSGKTVPVKDACDIKLNFDAYSAGTVCYAVYLIDVAWAKVDTKATGALVQNPTNVGDEHTQNAGANRRSCHQKSGHYTSASNHSLST